MANVFKATLCREINGEVEYIYPKTYADIVEYDAENSVKDMIDKLESTKVDKEEGKGLVSNDFTNAYARKLINTEIGAVNYVLPMATTNVLGGYKLGFPTADKNYAVLEDSGHRLYINVPSSDIDVNKLIDISTPTTKGLMSKELKARLDTIEEGATYFETPYASENNLGIGYCGYKDYKNNYGVIQDEDDDISRAAHIKINYALIDIGDSFSDVTVEQSGLMTPEDKIKLDEIEDEANLYIHPTYDRIETPEFDNSDFIIFSIDTDNTGHVLKQNMSHVTIPTYTATVDRDGLMSKEDKCKLHAVIPVYNHLVTRNIVRRKNSEFRDEDISHIHNTELSETISAGEFENLYLGQYFIRKVNGYDIKFIIAGFDTQYDLVATNKKFTNHHIEVIMGDILPDKVSMYRSNDYEQGYISSYINQNVIPYWMPYFNTALTGFNIMLQQLPMSTKIDTDLDCIDAIAYAYAYTSLLSVREVYGKTFDIENDEMQNTVSKYISDEHMLPYFKFQENIRENENTIGDYWLRDYYNFKHQCYCSVAPNNSNPVASKYSNYHGVRLKFLLG